MTPMGGYGVDPRRRLTLDERRYLYAAADGHCQNCGGELGSDYHNAHMGAHVGGGATNVENVRAECPTCNLRLGPNDIEQVEGLQLRQWQALALPVILRQLWQSGVATLHAAPGAGKTKFAGAVFQRLFDAGEVSRLVVVVPNLAIVEQWRDALGGMKIHLDIKPRDGFLEYPQTVGAVVTYHGLPGAAGAHATRIEQTQTLVVLDEVHHVADNAAWGDAVRRMVGDLVNGSVRPAGVLNMTGTLFRSGKSKRISTVRYQRVDTDEGEKFQAVADWSEPTSNLIAVELRAPDLYAYGAQAQLIDLRDEKLITGEIADLDHQQRSAVIRNSYTSKDWLRGFATEAVRLLRLQLAAVNDEEPLKLLFITNGTKEARLAAAAINAVTRQNFSRLVVSDEPQALRTLRAAVRDRHSCAIVAVKMVTEGFDCAQVSTIAYATNVTADLFIAQTMARAMRITTTERANRRLLPAQILIPDHPELRRVFAAALVNALHMISEEDQADHRPDAGATHEPRLPRYELLELTDPRLDSVTVLTQKDEPVPGTELPLFAAQCTDVGVPETYAPRVGVIARRYRPPLRTYAVEEEQLSAPGSAPVIIDADPRSVNLAHRARLKTAAGWMSKHIDHDDRYPSVEIFQASANDAAGIRRGERDHASAEQLQACAAWMCAQVVEHCRALDERAPSWASGEDQ